MEEAFFSILREMSLFFLRLIIVACKMLPFVSILKVPSEEKVLKGRSRYD